MELSVEVLVVMQVLTFRPPGKAWGVAVPFWGEPRGPSLCVLHFLLQGCCEYGPLPCHGFWVGLRLPWPYIFFVIHYL